MRLPTAPYHEHAVRAEVARICVENGLKFEQDQFGNVLVRLRTAPARHPFVLAAHMDHPGFEVVRRLSDRRWLLRFRGGVGDQYFRPGLVVRLMPGAVRGKLGRRHDGDKAFEVEISRPMGKPPEFAVWELEDFAVRRGLIHGRGCDDVVGVAAILATIIELKRKRSRVNVIGLITRAEEVGFHGALAVAANGGLAGKSLIVSLETSRELPGVKMGHGVILRVGDRTSIFDSAAMRFLAEVASALKTKHKAFQFQRGLMGGGTCEATAFQEFGFQAAAVCVALGNYHNCAEGNRIKAEYVSIADTCNMVDLLVAAAGQMPHFKRLTSKLPKRLRQMALQAAPQLRRTAAG
jgi:endoglucanase